MSHLIPAVPVEFYDRARRLVTAVRTDDTATAEAITTGLTRDAAANLIGALAATAALFEEQLSWRGTSMAEVDALVRDLREWILPSRCCDKRLQAADVIERLMAERDAAIRRAEVAEADAAKSAAVAGSLYVELAWLRSGSPDRQDDADEALRRFEALIEERGQP